MAAEIQTKSLDVGRLQRRFQITFSGVKYNLIARQIMSETSEIQTKVQILDKSRKFFPFEYRARKSLDLGHPVVGSSPANIKPYFGIVNMWFSINSRKYFAVCQNLICKIKLTLFNNGNGMLQTFSMASSSPPM